jgi:hypothetical protein
MIDSYNVTHSLELNSNEGFDVIIHTEVTPKLNEHNYFQAPKLRYYFLEKSKGYVQILNKNEDKIESISMEDSRFKEIKLNDIYI